MKTGVLRLLGTALLACALPAAVRATDYPSQANGGWREQEQYSPGNWWMKVWHTAPGSYPGSGDDVTIGHTVSATTNEVCQHLYLNSNGLYMIPNTLTLESDSQWLRGDLQANVQFQSGTFSWHGGTYLGVFQNPDTVELIGPGLKTLRYYSSFHNHGALRHTGSGALHIYGNPNSAFLYNWSNALYEIHSDGTNLTSDYGQFDNYGMLRKSAGGGTSWVSSVFNNYGGMLEVQTGTLVLASMGTRSNGTLTAAAGATLDLTGGSGPTYRGLFTGSGSGVVQFASGTMYADTPSATFALSNGLYWNGAATLRGTLINPVLVVLAGPDTKTIRYASSVHNYGTLRHTGSGALHIYGNPNSAFLYNWSNALYDIQSDGTNLTSDYGQFDNYGTLRKSAGSGTSLVSSVFNNFGGTLDVQTGTLVLASTGTRSNGIFQVAEGATLDLTGTAGPTYCGQFTDTGSGIVQFHGGALNTGSPAPSFALTNGLSWNGAGVLRGTLNNMELMILSGADSKQVFRCTLNNYGMIRHTGAGSLHLNGNPATSYLVNHSNGFYDMRVDGTVISEDYGIVDNFGTLCKTDGVGTSRVACTVHNYGGTLESRSGTLRLNGLDHVDGILRLAGGSLSLPAFTLSAGRLEGTGTVTVAGTLSSAGAVSPGLSAGRLAISGNYAQGAAGTLAIELGGRAAGTEHDVLAVSGNAALGGTLAVTLTNGFAPALTDAFTIVTCGSRSGVFAATNLPALGADRCWRVLYANTQVVLAVHSIAAEVIAPSNGAVFTAPGIVPLSATVTDTAGAVTQVAFLVNGSLAGVSASITNPYTFNWAAGAGRHTIACRALDSAGLMTTSGPVTVSVAPAAPTGVAAGDGTDAARVRVTWSASAGASGYQVWRHTANNSSAASRLGAAGGTAYNDTGAVPGTRYYYWVKATNAWAAGLFSASDSGYRTVTAPGGVTAGDAEHADKVRVAWTAVAGCTSYQVFRHRANNSAAAALLATVAAPPYDDRSAAAGTPYYFWVKARRGIATSAFSASDRGWRRTVSPRLAGDYDGDGLADPAVYTPATGTWKVWLSGSGYAPVILSGLLGGPNAVPASADFDGDRKTDPAVYTESGGQWIVLLSGSGYARLTLPGLLGGAGWSPCPADYDGDRLADPAVYQEGAGRWKAMRSGSGYAAGLLPYTLGGAGWGPCPADFDGDRKADLAVYAEATGGWQVLLSASGYGRVSLAAFLGGLNWVPVPADYDGDGLADPAVTNPATREWRVKLSGSGYAEVRVVL